MSTKHYPFYGGSFDRIIFDGDGSVWVPESENAKLRDSIKALMTGTYAELCADRDESQCRECSMRSGDDSCATADAMELLGIDVFGEPLEVDA